MSTKQLKRRVRKAFKGMGFSNPELAERLNVTAVTVWRWRHRKRLPHPVFLEKLEGIVRTELAKPPKKRWKLTSQERVEQNV